jgi:two-component system CheB/CheR fusion protein
MKNLLHNAEQASLVTAFPIVGIGASAGGLEAVGELLKNLPPDTGMAFVFVQHLAPDRKSLLCEILAKKTVMPVMEVTEGQLIAPNHLYVIPPNTILTVVQGRFALKPRHDVSGLPLPIDDLFYSLAEDQGSYAIGIALSGAGSDGALGMQAIKNEGGVTFAQDELSAEYSSMPRAAVSLGCVDFVLPPPGIAQELLRLNHLPSHENLAASNHELLVCDEADFARIFQLLRHTSSLDFTHYKRGTVKRRLARRMALQNLTKIHDYIHLLETVPDELAALGKDFLIHVTSFFRDQDAFEMIIQDIFHRIIDGHAPDVPLRIWVPGCSTGEEVYSLAICCLEYLQEHNIELQIQVFGTDVSEGTLSIARAGIYSANMVRNVSAERLKKFFTKVGDQYQIIRLVRDLCVFARHDVTSDPPFSQLDLVSCRNLLIYLNPFLQKRAIPLLHYALKPEGILLLGPAENVDSFADIFSPVVQGKIKFYVKIPLTTQSQLKYLDGYAGKSVYTPSLSAFTNVGLLKKKYTEVDQQKREADRITLRRYVPAAVLCDKHLNVLEFRGDTGPYLLQPSGPPESNLQKLARPGLLIEISKAVRKAGIDGTPVRKTGVKIKSPEGDKDIILQVIPVQQSAITEPWFLVFFEAALKTTLAPPTMPGFWAGLGVYLQQRILEHGRDRRQPRDDDAAVLSKQNLDDTHDYIRTMMEEYESTKEELQASQEELLSSNEELQSTNEELETAKEELQSSNEELLTTNEGAHQRNRKLNELNDKLHLALNYAEAVLNTAHQPFLVLDGKLSILRANPAFYRAFKTTPETTQGRLLYDLGDKQWDIPELRQFLQALLLQDTSFKDCEITHAFPDVGLKTMRLNGTNLIGGEQYQILLAIEDVSDYRTALDTLKGNDRHKDEFLAMLAHELRNPLVPIRNAMEIWKRGDAGALVEKDLQVIMDRQLQKVVRLVDDLLDVSRITRGVITLKKDAVDIVQLVNQTVEGVRHDFDTRQHELSLFLPEAAVLVEGDAIRLEQVVSNLLINACKYTDPGGHIVVVVKREPRNVVIQIIDNGIGIAPELLPHIFDLFVQAGRTLDRTQGGLGIGLTLVRRLVALHEGTVEAKSAGLNQGSEFIVHLPIMAAAADTVPGHDVNTLPLLRKRRILVIEDNIDSAKTTQMLLELQGHQVQVAYGGLHGIETAQTFKPEVIILDIGLPGMDGYEVARRLRKLPGTEKILLIALSGYGQADDIQKSTEAGFDHHLVKPADTNQLQALISH